MAITDNAVVGFDDLVYLSPSHNVDQGTYGSAGAVDPGEDVHFKYDHRDGLSFITATSINLNKFIIASNAMGDAELSEKREQLLSESKIESTPFPKSNNGELVTVDSEGKEVNVPVPGTGIVDPGSDFAATGSTIRYDIGSGDFLEVKPSIQKEDGTFEQIEWNADLIALMTGQRDVRDDEVGTIYRLNYEWTDGHTVKAQGSKKVDLVQNAWLRYLWNDEGLAGERVVPAADVNPQLYYVDPGSYAVGDSVSVLDTKDASGNVTSTRYPVDPVHDGYTFKGWSTDKDVDPDTFSNASPTWFDATTPLHSGLTNVYAVWDAGERTLQIAERTSDPENPSVLKQDKVDFGTPLLEYLDKVDPSTIKDPQNPQKGPLLGWSTDPESFDPITDTERLVTPEDKPLVVYPIWAADPSLTESVVNETHPKGENKVGDVLSYTYTATNDALDSDWRDVKLVDPLPNGMDLVPGTIVVTGPDGKPVPVDESEVYDPETRTITVPLGDILGKETYTVTFKTQINEKAIDYEEGEEGDENRDITNKAKAEGTQSDGKDPLDVDAKEIAPNPEETEGGKVTAEEPDGKLSKTVANETDPGAYTQVGDVLVYSVSSTNVAANSVWSDVTIRDFLPAGLTLVPGTITATAPDGTATPVPDSAYDPADRSVSWKVGSISANQVRTLTFKVTVDKEAVGKDIGNVAFSTGYTPHDQPEGAQTGDPTYPDTPKDKDGKIDKRVYLDDAQGKVSKTAKNLTNPKAANAKVGDTVEFAITAANDTPASKWADGVVADKLPVGLTLIPGSMYVTMNDGLQKQVPVSAYDANTRTIAVYVGALLKGQKATLTFQALVNEEAVGKDIGNVAYVLAGSEVPDDPWHEALNKKLEETGQGGTTPQVGDWMPVDDDMLEAFVSEEGEEPADGAGMGASSGEAVYPNEGKGVDAADPANPANPPATTQPGGSEGSGPDNGLAAGGSGQDGNGAGAQLAKTGDAATTTTAALSAIALASLAALLFLRRRQRS